MSRYYRTGTRTWPGVTTLRCLVQPGEEQTRHGVSSWRGVDVDIVDAFATTLAILDLGLNTGCCDASKIRSPSQLRYR